MIYLQHLESGLMEVISPPSEFYPDLAGLRKTLGKNISQNKMFWILKILSSNHRGRYGKGDMAVEAVPWFQLSNDVSIKQFKFIVEIGFSFLDSIRITARYAKSRGTFYVQLEDDVLTKKGFISIMKHFALEKIADKQSWSYYIFARIQNLFSKALHQQILKKWNFSLQVCYWLLSTGFHWKNVQICGTSLARSVLPHVLQR